MSEMSSFYGGRQGASFVIVKRFDGIDIPQVEGQEQYTKALYAVNANTNNFLLVSAAEGGNVAVGDNVYLIKQTSKNKNDYIWQVHLNNGSAINSGQYNFPTKLAEGMVQCFSQGAKSASEVNYGEYVIIDTVTEMNDRNNPDNGKIYRRGMDINSELAGAEYIGCMVGPKGDSVELSIVHYDDIEDPTGFDEYTVTDGDLVPGWHDDRYEDSIKYIYATIKDNNGNIEGTEVGFKIPTLVQDFYGNPVSHRYRAALIEPDEEQYVDGKWLHPFFQRWRINIPKGIPGKDAINFHITPTKTAPIGYFDENFQGAALYDSKIFTEEHFIAYAAQPLDTIEDIDSRDAYWIEVQYNDPQYEHVYTYKNQCYMDTLYYDEVDHSALVDITTYKEVGLINSIERIHLSDNGILTVYYRGELLRRQQAEKLRWIDTESSTGIVIDNDGSMHVYYNTTHEPRGSADPYERVDTQNRAHDHDDFPNVLKWVSNITIDSDGTIKFYDNTNPSVPAYTFTQYLKCISNVQIQTVASGATDEGTGDQKVHITYNTGATATVGNPLNYIIETAVVSTTPSTSADPPYGHLLVYYADPALRSRYATHYTYPSSKYPNKTWTEWIDLGDVRGDAGGIHILKNVYSLVELSDGTNDIPPEELKDESGQIISENAAGWTCTYTPGTFIATTSSDPEALQIVADYRIPNPGEIRFSLVDNVNPGQFRVGEYVKFSQTSDTELLCFDYDKNKWYTIGTVFSDNYVVKQTETTTSENYEVLLSGHADNITRSDEARKNSQLTFNPATGNLQVTKINGVNVGASPKFTDENTTYTFDGGVNGFEVTASDGSTQTVGVTPSIANNVTGSGTSGNIAKFNGNNTITDGPAFGNSTFTYLRNDGEWIIPPNTTYSFETGTTNGQIKVVPSNDTAYNVQVKGLSNLAYIGINGSTTQFLRGDGTWAAPANNQVSQINSNTTDANLSVLLSYSATGDTETQGVRKDSDLKYNPSTNNLTVGKINNVTQRAPLYNQILSFDSNLVATIAVTGITAQTAIEVYYQNREVAINSQIVAETGAGEITFTAQSAPSENIICNIYFRD